MTLPRRSLLRAAGASGALLLTGPGAAWAARDRQRPPAAGAPLPSAPADPRASRLVAGERLAHADLHNHTHLSDGVGDEALAFDALRAAGLDVAALTDHATVGFGAVGQIDPCAFEATPHGEANTCRSVAGLTEEGWARTAALADAADDPGRFAAIRGFEWSSPALGHVNVWFSQRWIDPLHTGGIASTSRYAETFRGLPQPGPEAARLFDDPAPSDPLRTGMAPFYRWLGSDPSTRGLGGGLDGLAGFNHPGREPGRFAGFRPAPEVGPRMVSMEIFNRREDYLFRGLADGHPSPLCECLDAGWRVGLIGVSDEHGPDWGATEGTGRAGLWVRELTRGGVREALWARRVFATREHGLRVDAVARAHRPGGAPPPWTGEPGVARMGGSLPHAAGPVEFAVDLGGGDEWAGRPVQVQVLRPGTPVPTVVHLHDARIPVPGEPLIRFSVRLDVAAGPWVVLRVADPARPNTEPGPAGHPANTFAVAYTSPFWLTHPGA